MTTLRGLRVLISGAGVAGPALACALNQYGAEVTVVEIAPKLRAGGFAVDFRGPTHLTVLERLGVLDELREVQTHGGAMVCVDEQGREIFRLPAELMGGELEVARKDLSAAFYRRSAGNTEYLFGETITGLTETPDGVLVGLSRSEPRMVDLVVGADGFHSAVRRLHFGPEAAYVKHLGHYIAGWSVPNSLGIIGEAQHYNVPGRLASIGGDQRDPGTATVLAVFASPAIDVDYQDVQQQKDLITKTYANLGWHVPLLLQCLEQAQDLYFDAISRVHLPSYTSGRVVLLGDAAWGVTLGGMGVGCGVVGAYVLAGELAAAQGDYRQALPAYERRMLAYAGRWQRRAQPGRVLAPRTSYGLRLRNKLFSSQRVQKMMMGGTKTLAADTDLPDYPNPLPSSLRSQKG